MKRVASNGIGLMLIVGLAGLTAFAQTSSNSQSASSGQSLGDYARQVRKEPNAKSTPKVFDNDNLPKSDKLSVVGTPEPPAANEQKPAEGASAASQEAKPNGDAQAAENKSAEQGAVKEPKPLTDEEAKQAAVKQWTDKLNEQKKQIDMLSREQDVLQREYQIRAAAMYADAGNRLRNQADWDKQDAQYKQQIADKQKAVEDAKQKLSDMQEEARKAGMPSSVREE